MLGGVALGIYAEASNENVYGPVPLVGVAVMVPLFTPVQEV